jgi:DNA-directed RNA polymerase specialized sigma24 family protein
MAQQRPLVAQVTKDAYLVLAIRRELIRYLEKEELHREREEAQEPAVLEDKPLCAPEQERRLNHWAVEQAIARFLKRPRAKQIDAQILAAIRDDSERSSASIARELGVPETTVRYRRRLLMEFLSKDRGN